MTTYARPSYTEITTRIEADLAAIPAVLRGPLSIALSKTDQGEHGHLDWIDKQCSPLTCELERLYDWAALYGVDRLKATYAIGGALATGAVETPLLSGVQLRGGNGLDYTVLSAISMGSGATPVSIRCNTSGSNGNLIAGQTLTLIDPVPGCDSTLTVDASGITGGDEEENVDDWRVRVAEEWNTVVTSGARSGKDADYRFWARSAHPSVTGALIQRHIIGIGTVVVRPICNGLTDRMPTPAVIEAVRACLLAKAPATADWRVSLPIKRLVNVSIHLLPGFDTAATRGAIFSAINASVMAEDSETSLLAMAEIDAATATVTSQYTRLAPTADIEVASGEVLVMAPIVWA